MTKPDKNQAPAEGADDLPPPEEGSPGGDKAKNESGAKAQGNPLAPPVNIGAGS